MKQIKSEKTGFAQTPTILTVREVSDHLRVQPTTIYRLLSTKQIPTFRIGSDWRFDSNAIERWVSHKDNGSTRAA